MGTEKGTLMAETQPMMLQELCYTAADFRLQLGSLVCDEGVADLNDGSLLVTTGGSGLNVSVAEGAAFINSDAADQGVYSVYNDAPVTLTATTASGANPRVDQIIATVNDSQISGTDDDWVLSILAGTPNAAAALTPAGIAASATALPDRSIRLAYLLVPTSFAGPFVNATHILDSRSPWVSCSEAPYVSLEASAATSTGAGVYTQLALATNVHTDPGYFTVASNTITVLQAGLYDISAMAGYSGAGTTGTARALIVTKNNTNLPNSTPDGLFVLHASDGPVSFFVDAPARQSVVLAANDTLKLALLQTTAGSVNSYHAAGTFVAHLTVRKVG